MNPSVGDQTHFIAEPFIKLLYSIEQLSMMVITFSLGTDHFDLYMYYDDDSFIAPCLHCSFINRNVKDTKTCIQVHLATVVSKLIVYYFLARGCEPEHLGRSN